MIKQAYLMSSAELAKKTGSDIQRGLSPGQADTSRERYGANVFDPPPRESLIRRVLAALTEPMLIMLHIAAGITLAVNIMRFVGGGEYNFLECIGIFAAIFLSAAITVITEGRSAKAFEALTRINEEVRVKVIRGGNPALIPQKDVVTGDLLLLETGDRIVADGLLIESHDLYADESSLTGESMPVMKDTLFTPDKSTPIAERKNMLYSGCFVTSGSGKMIVSGVGSRTEFGRIAAELALIEKSATPLQEKLHRLGQIITILGASAAAFAFIVQIVQLTLSHSLGVDPVSDAFITSIVLIVAAVPEGLPTIVAVALALNISKMADENALVKKLSACETIGCVNVICTDKTGTLTENKMRVLKFYRDRRLHDAAEFRDECILKNACINSSANINKLSGKGKSSKQVSGKYEFIGNPTECALLAAASDAGLDYRMLRSQAEIVKIFPFSSQHKDMSTIVREGDELILYTKGNPEKILDQCDNIPDDERDQIRAIMEDFQRDACRLLGFAHRGLEKYPNLSHSDPESNHTDSGAVGSGSESSGDNSCKNSICPDDASRNELTRNLIYDGFAVISDPLAPGVHESIAQCADAGIEVKMLTGDNIRTAISVASELEILDEGHIAVEGSDVEALSDIELKKALPGIGVIARSTPFIKSRVVGLLKESGNVVAVTGDGVNDAPAIKCADIGIAMGITGTEVSKEAGDMVLLDDSFATIVKAVMWGRGIYENFKRFIQFQLTVNLSAAAVVIACVLAGSRAPFTALDLLWINIIMDGPPALTLGLEPIRKNLLNRPPTRRDDGILTRSMYVRIFFNGLVITFICMLQHFTNFLGAASGREATVLFTLFVLLELFNAFNCRELGREPILTHLTGNRLMLFVFLIVLGIQWIITQCGTAVFNTVPISPAMWGKILICAFSVIIASEIRKACSGRKAV